MHHLFLRKKRKSILKFLKRTIKSKFSKDKELYESIKNIIGFYPDNIFLYKQAFRHRSSAIEVKSGFKDSNERLEYLGDAILSAVIADYLFKRFPYKDEGFLTEMRSKIVSRASLNKLSEKLSITKLVQKNNDTGINKSLAGDAFEALIGAIYIDKGYDFTKEIMLNRILKFHIDVDNLESSESNYKSRLIEWVQKEKKNIEFVIAEEIGFGSSKLFSINAVINGKVEGNGKDFLKKKAEQIAAEEAYLSIISKNSKNNL